ncbi:HtaA domain-containing protein [Corynebacterium sp. zg-331]|uniref:HtaA domain-containing protein n=1 Tax=unclassified Corynebacterium TaxID=2624378 RepID=UPI00128BA707|nr:MULTISPECIES: HtaA domain-containing protein [unclassified Corynebacterium]MBC3185660.1 HtaA domain-containing protein [Corynebacterium sp. zg-331]MPV52154.1 hemin receptor [Corynebacterium sp. zg331]
MRSASPWKAVAASAAVAGLSLVSAPVIGPVAAPPIAAAAQAGECRKIDSGTLDWGIKQSFRSYLTGPIARGGWQLDGAEFRGEERGGGAFRFTADPERAALSGEDADIPLRGSVRMTGHFGALTITLSDLEVQIRGAQGQIVGRMSSQSPALVSSVLGLGGGSGQRVPLATLTLDRPLPQALGADGTAVVSATTRLTEEANQALGGNYGEGNDEGDTATLSLRTAPGAGECAGVDPSVRLASAPRPGVASAAETTSPPPAVPAEATAALPDARCAEVTSASAGWGIKQSFRNYLTGPIAAGGWDLDGVEYRGSRGGAEGQFAFTSPQGQATVTPEGADIPLAGTISLHGHLGLLAIDMSNMSVKVRGNRAQFIADFSSNIVNRPAPGAKVTGRETGTQAVIAEFTLDSPITPEALAAGELRLHGGGSITAEGNRAFGGNYGEGNNQADPLDVVLSVEGARDCGAGLSDHAAGAPAGAVTTNPGGRGAIPRDRTAPADPPGFAVATPAQAPADVAVGGRGASQAPTSGTCDEAATQAVSDARLGWGVKDSFRTYVRGPIAYGGWRLSGATESGGNFVFSGNQGAVDTAAARGTIGHGGAVTFYGHEGVLNTTIANPEIQFEGGTGALIAEVTSNDTEGNAVNYGRIAVADLTVNIGVSGDVLDGTAAASLTQAGASALGNFYPAGTQMAPVSFKAALSGAASCAAVTGAAAATGAGAGARTLSQEDIAALGKPADPSSEPPVPPTQAAPSGSRTSLLDAEAQPPRSAAVALAANPMTPPSLVVLLLGLAGLGVYLFTGRRAATTTEADDEE